MKYFLLIPLLAVSMAQAEDSKVNPLTPGSPTTLYLGNMEPLLAAIKSITGITGPPGANGGTGLWVSSSGFQYNAAVSTVVFVGLGIDSISYQNGIATITINLTRFWTYTTTADALITKFGNFRSTGDAGLLSTGTVLYNYIVINGTNTNLIHSSNTWDAAQAFISSVTFSSPTITFAGVTLLMQSTPTLGTAGDDILHRNRVSSQTYWGGDDAGSGGGGSVIGFRSVFSTNAVTNAALDAAHPFIISTNTLQAGTTVYVASMTVSGNIISSNVYINNNSSITGILSLSAGSANRPSLNIAGPGSDTAGFFSPGTQQLGLSLSGAQQQSWSLNTISINSGVQIQSAIGSRIAPSYSFGNSIVSGLFLDGTFVPVVGMSVTSNHIQSWWGTGQTSIGRWMSGIGTAGSPNVPPATLTITTSAVSNTPALIVSTGPLAAYVKLFEVDGASASIKTSTLCIGSFCGQWFSTAPPASGDYIFHFNADSKTVYIGGDSGAGSSGGGGGGVWVSTSALQFYNAASTVVFLGDLVSSAAYFTGGASIYFRLDASAIFNTFASTVSAAILTTGTAVTASFASTLSTYTALLTTGAALYNYIVINASNTNVNRTTYTWTAGQIYWSSPTWSAYGSTWGIGSNNLIWQSTPTLGTVGDDVLHRDRVSSTTYWGGDNAGSGSGGAGFPLASNDTGYLYLPGTGTVQGSWAFKSTQTFERGISLSSSILISTGSVVIGTNVATALLTLDMQKINGGITNPAIIISSVNNKWFEVNRDSSVAFSSFNVVGVFTDTTGFVVGGSTAASLLLAAGVVGSPSIYWVSPTGATTRKSGLYSSGTDITAIVSNGTVRFDANTTGAQVSGVLQINSNTVPQIVHPSNAGSGLYIDGTTSGLIDFISDVSAGRRKAAGLRTGGFYVGGAISNLTTVGASLQIGTSAVANLSLLSVSSDIPRFEVTGDSSTFWNRVNITSVVTGGYGLSITTVNGAVGGDFSYAIFSTASAVPSYDFKPTSAALNVATTTVNGTLIVNGPLTGPQISVSTTASWAHFSVSTNGYVNLASSSPAHALSSCGTSPAIYGGGSAFTIVPGATASGCTITFGVPFKRPPIPIVAQRVLSLTNSLSYTVNTTALTLTETAIGTVDILLIGTDNLSP